MAGNPGDDQDIFESGSAPEPSSGSELPPQDLVERQTPEDEAVSQAIRALDRGPPQRQPAPPAPPPAQPPGQPPGGQDVEDRSLAGLMKAMLDERQQRQALQQEMHRIQQEREASKPPAVPLSQRLFEDPDGTIADLRREIVAPLEQRITEMSVNHDFSLTAVRHPEVFDEAWKAWYGAVGTGQNAALYFGVMNAPSPGEAMIEWYQDQRMRTPEGQEAYRQQIINEYLQSQGGVITPAPAPNARPRAENGRFTPQPPAPQLPTATSRMGQSGNGMQTQNEDGSEEAIFDSGRPSRRK